MTANSEAPENDFSHLRVGVFVAFSHPRTVNATAGKSYELFQRGESQSQHWFMFSGETEYASESIGADDWTVNGGYICEHQWTEWTDLHTRVGLARVRSRFLRCDGNYHEEEFQVSLDGQVWSGRASGCVSGHQAYELNGIRAVDHPDLHLKGEEHAASLDAFVSFGLPLVVNGCKASPDIGKPLLDEFWSPALLAETSNRERRS